MQVCITPPADSSEWKLREAQWFDINRIGLVADADDDIVRTMPVPDFAAKLSGYNLHIAEQPPQGKREIGFCGNEGVAVHRHGSM